MVNLMPLHHLHVYTSGSIIKRTTPLVESVFCDQRYCCQRTCEFRTRYNPTRLHEALARGHIARDPPRSHQIPWLRVRLREMMKWREATGLRVISHAYN